MHRDGRHPAGLRRLSAPGTGQGSHPATIAPADPSVWLRPAGPADEALARELFVAARADLFVQTALEGPVRDLLLDQQFRLQNATYRQRFPAADAYVIAQRDRAVGRVLLDRQRANWHVVDIAVLPACREQGIGTAVMAGIEAAARIANVGTLSLVVLTGNFDARRLYRRLGFTETETLAGGAYVNAIKPLRV